MIRERQNLSACKVLLLQGTPFLKVLLQLAALLPGYFCPLVKGAEESVWFGGKSIQIQAMLARTRVPFYSPPFLVGIFCVLMHLIKTSGSNLRGMHKLNVIHTPCMPWCTL